MGDKNISFPEKVEDYDRLETKEEQNREDNIRDEISRTDDIEYRRRLKKSLKEERARKRNVRYNERRAKFNSFKSPFVKGYGSFSNVRKKYSGAMSRLSKAYHSLPTDPFERVNVDNLGFDNIGGKSFDFKMPKMNINEGFDTKYLNSLNIGFNKGYRYRKRHRRSRYRRHR